MNGYITKTELIQRWSKKLVEAFFPKCSLERRNPRYKRASPMQLYDLKEVEKIERRKTFKEASEKASRKKAVAQKVADCKRQRLIELARTISINLPDMDKDSAIKLACHHYNQRNQMACHDYTEATPSSDEAFLKRITTNFLRHQCTRYDTELGNFFGKVGVQEAHKILKERINRAIAEKYDWI